MRHLLLILLLARTPYAAASLRCDITRDTWVSEVGREADGNNGGARRLKTKGIQEFAIVDLDPAPLRGRVITSAALHLCVASPDIQRRITVSTLASEWVEGTASGYAVQKGSASFRWAEQDVRPWAFPGSDILAVMNSAGGTIWGFADATKPDATGYQTIPVDPAVVAARVAGISHGFVVFDDVGSEYERNGDSFKYLPFRNRFVYSREEGKNRAPYFTVQLGAEDRAAPDAPARVTSDTRDLPPGQAVLHWTTPKDNGPAGVIGFVARYAEGENLAWASAKPVLQYLLPAAAAGEVRMHLRDLNLKPGATVSIGIRAVDGAGNASEPAVAVVRTSAEQLVQLKLPPIKPFEGAAPLPAVAGVKVAVIDALDKVHPLTGDIIPPHDKNYLQANHLWSAAGKTVRLHAAKAEFVDFQIVLEGDAPRAKIELQIPVTSARVYRFRHVTSKSGPLPDPLVSADDAEKLPGQKFATYLAELYVPRDAKPGDHTGTLKITIGNDSLSLAVSLHVWNFTLPDHLSFIPEMNCYGLPDPPADLAYYRLAHEHRTCLNRLGYGWRGQTDPACAPSPVGKTFRWDKYDAHFAPLLDGSAFKDLPRGPVPVETFYLPLNENWPADVNKSFTGGYWADTAFAPGYREAFVAACAEFAKHFKERGWTQTLFEFYLNNKVYHKETTWSRSSAPWVFDEPVNTQDFWALRWFGAAFHEGVAPHRGDVKMAFRCDISRPQWQRELLDGLLDVNVVGGPFRQYNRMILDRKQREQHVLFNYGSTNPIESSNVQPVGWCIDTWTLGGDGVLPWQTIGTPKSWESADPLSLFYPGQPANSATPIPSVRLKAHRRGQQDVEYLTILTASLNRPRWAIAEPIRDALHLSAQTSQQGEDAAQVTFNRLTPEALWTLRTRIGAILDDLRPPAKARWHQFRPPPRDPRKLPDIRPLQNEAR